MDELTKVVNAQRQEVLGLNRKLELVTAQRDVLEEENQKLQGSLDRLKGIESEQSERSIKLEDENKLLRVKSRQLENDAVKLER